MATLWDDLKVSGRRVREALEERSGRIIVERQDFERVVEAAADGQVYRKELEFVGWTILNHSGGTREELKPQSRKHLALKSLNAFISDPQAGRIVENYVSFVFGRGIPKAQAHDPEVQKEIDTAWGLRANKRVLTTAAALAEKGRDYCIQSNVYFLYFDDGDDGNVRMSLAKFDTVDEVYRHPEDRLRILYYVARERRQKWDPQNHTTVDADPNSPPVVRYYEALDAFDEEDLAEVVNDEGLWTPPDGMVARGKLLHVAGNKVSEQAFGVPQFKRLLRWLTAYNEMLESFADRMKAAARLYMKANVTGGKSAVERAGMMAVRRASPMSQPPPVEGDGPMVVEQGIPQRGTLGVVAGNQSLNYEPFKIDSGAGDVSNAAPIMQGQTAAAGGFPKWYGGGDPGSQAGSTSVELPVLKMIEVEQETWARPFRTLADLQIKRAVETGRLDEWREATDEEKVAIEAGDFAGEVDDRGRVKRDLGYDFALPTPVQRAMGDFVSAAVQTATAVDPNGDFPDLSRWLFGFILAEAFDVEDPQRIVDQYMPMSRVRELEEQRREMQAMAQEGARAATEAQRQELESTTGADGQQHPPDNPTGAKRESSTGAATGGDRQVRQAAAPDEGHDRRARARTASRARRREVVGDFDSIVGATASRQLEELAAATSNGNGNHGGDQ